MYHFSRLFPKLALLLALTLLVLPAGAMELELPDQEDFSFSAEDFTTLSDQGIFLTAVPNRAVASVYYGSRMLRAGDALPVEALDRLTLVPVSALAEEASIRYYTIADDRAAGTKELKLRLKPGKNEPPTALDSNLETYKNIENAGELQARDPEQEMLTYAIVKEPRRGTVTLAEDGSFTYSPAKNKVGKDAFQFVVTDPAGNVSEPATVSILIRTPSDKAVYQDMAQDSDAFEAMWLKDQGLFSGSQVGGNLCFSPDAPVTRGEFLVMVMNMVEAEAAEVALTSGFADEPDTPVWMQPYIVTALNNGMISGVSSENGVVFRPGAAMTKAETAVMLRNVLQLPAVESTAVFASQAEAVVPAWAADAAAALSQAGLELEMTSDTDPLTRRDAACLLYEADRLLQQADAPTFFWQN